MRALKNGVTVKTVQETVLQAFSGVKILEFATTNTCRAKFYYNGPEAKVYIFPNGTKIDTENYLQGLNTLEFNVEVPGQWIIYIDYGLANSDFNAQFKSLLTTFSNNKCENYCMGKAGTIGTLAGTTNVCECADWEYGMVWNPDKEMCECQGATCLPCVDGVQPPQGQTCNPGNGAGCSRTCISDESSCSCSPQFCIPFCGDSIING